MDRCVECGTAAPKMGEETSAGSSLPHGCGRVELGADAWWARCAAPGCTFSAGRREKRDAELALYHHGLEKEPVGSSQPSTVAREELVCALRWSQAMLRALAAHVDPNVRPSFTFGVEANQKLLARCEGEKL